MAIWRRETRWLVGLGLAACLIPGQSEAAAPAGSAVETPLPEQLEAQPIARMPLAVHRRAARYFEAIRLTSDSNWFDAHLGSHATPMLRPGVRGPAYWEVAVEGSRGEPLGYILLSTGEHDFPVVGAARGGEPPSVQLRRMASLSGAQVTRIWAPAPFVFVAEDRAGVEVARLGSLPERMEGVDASALDLPDSARRGTSIVEPGKAPVVHTPEALAGLRMQPFASWDEYKRVMGSESRLEQAIVERNAAPFWRSERQVERTAQELSSDDAVRIQILQRGKASFEVSGSDAERVEVTRESGPAGEQWLRVRALSAPESGVGDAKISLTYASGEREVLGFAIAPVLGAPGPTKALLPASCKTVALRTSVKGNYLRALERKGEIDARADKVGVWETFELTQKSDGTIALRAGPANRYVAALEGGGKSLALHGDAVGAWETFKLVSQPGGTYALRASNGKYVSAKNGGGDIVTVDRAVASTWERFQVACNPPAPPVYFADFKDEATAWSYQRKYKQIDGKTSPNRSPCSSGCGATAWAMLIGYVDYAGSQGLSKYKPFDRIYLSQGGRGRFAVNALAPEFNDRGVQNMTVELRDAMNDWGVSGCAPNGERFTHPSIMAQSNQYFWGRVPGRVIADYDGLLVSTSAGTNKVVHTLRTRRLPIAIGMHNHYPVGFGIRSVTPRRWDPSGNKWVSAGSAEWMIDANWGWGEKFSRSVPLYSFLQGTLEMSPYSRVTDVAKACTLRSQSGGATGRVDRDYKCTTQLKNDERHVAMEVAADLVMRDVVPGLRSKNQKACLLKSTDVQCAPCSTTDRLIVRMDIRSKTQGCPSGTINELR
ncbi:MAG: hypothetical protein R3B07_13980 [Polyangiaceae bacterium]